MILRIHEKTAWETAEPQKPLAQSRESGYNGERERTVIRMATEIEMKLGVPNEEILGKVLEDPELTQYMKDDYEICHMHSTLL